MKNDQLNISSIKLISKLNKIKSKHLLIEKIFPFTYTRPLIFLDLINNDLTLENSMKNTYKSLKKNNNFSSKINQIFYKFIDLRKKYKENFTEKYLDDFEYIKSQLKYFPGGANIYKFYRHIFNDILNNNFSEKELNNFIIDYIQLYKNKKLFFFLISNYNNETYDNIDFLAKLTPNIIENYEINIICYFTSDSLVIPIELPENLKINSIYFISNFCNSKNFLTLMKYYISSISKFNFGIKKIIFDEFFTTYNLIDNTTYLEFFVHNYKNYSYNLDIDEIIIKKENNYSLSQIIYLKYNLKRIFSIKAWIWFYLTIITTKEWKNILNFNEKEENDLENKLNHFQDRQNHLKTLAIDLNYNSPYQENFIYLWHNYLGYNKTYNIIDLFNVGMHNLDINYYNKMKKQKCEISFPNMEILIIDDNKDMIFISKNEMIEFVELFFGKDRMKYLFKVVCYSGIKYIFINDIFKVKNLLPNDLSFLEIELDNLILKYSSNNIINIMKNNKNKDEVINGKVIQKIKEIHNILGKAFNQNIKIYFEDINIIKDINYFYLEQKFELYSKIITDKSQRDFLCKGLIKFIDKIVYIYNDFGEKDEYNININICKVINKYKKNKKNVLFIIKTKDTDENIFGVYKNCLWNDDKWIIFVINKRIILKTGAYEIPSHNFLIQKDSFFIDKKKYMILDFEKFGIKYKDI